jgi:Tol biopolymer transport system component
LRLGSLLVLALVVASAAAGASGRADGNLLLLRGQHVFVVTPAGADVGELTPPGFDVESAAWSRDGRRVALGANRHIWVMNADGSNLRQVTKGALSEGAPAWSPDGRRIAFSSARTGAEQVWVVPAKGGSLRHVSHRTSSCVDPAWSPDGRWIAFTCVLGFAKLLVARVSGRTDRVVTHAPDVIAEEDPTWTPDSKTLLFTRSKGVHLLGVYSVSSGGRGLRRLIAGAREPSVSPDGRRLAFIRESPLGRTAERLRRACGHVRPDCRSRPGLGQPLAHRWGRGSVPRRG